MKKNLLALLFAVALVAPAFAAEKNMWIGGSFGYSSVSSKAHPDCSNDAASEFTIAPELGYVLDEKWDIGLNLSYTKQKNTAHTTDGIDKLIPGSNGGSDSDTIGISPFARYNLAKVAGIDVLLKGSLFYNTSTIKLWGEDVKVNSCGITIAPVISYTINETWSISATLNFLELGYAHFSSSDLKNSAGDDYACDIFGLNVNDASIISIGFSYHF
ncbi:MAG: outer membrane beta-barrel protein [Elusimicrobia bacterium]|nr:outer membrane beta-barrel protein [Elusimicrobiota bacterium]